MYTIATAGHIDHGKSSLVKALTGTDPDRLPEEKKREMTIDLGFASFNLSTGEAVGIIDVPGHERFIKNMISGVGALDMVLFVIAADDGWMPQSEEHLAVLRYLGLERGIIVLTKVDLAEEAWREMVKSDLRTRTAGTFLEGCDIIEFSAVDNRNLDAIKASAEKILKSLNRNKSAGSARLYVDRVFTIAGTGSVVTGTLRDGTFSVNQTMHHHPSGEETKIKSLESFYSHLETAPAGIRLAVGLQSFDKASLKRGDLIYASSSLRESTLLGVRLSLSPKQAKYCKHGRDVLLLHGTAEIEGKLVLPSEPIVCPDGSVIAALKLESGIITKAGDRFVLRLQTPSILIGGGVIIDPVLEEIKRSSAPKWDDLAEATSTSLRELIIYELKQRQIAKAGELLQQSLYNEGEVAAELQKLTAEGTVLSRDSFVVLKEIWDKSIAQLISVVENYHKQNQFLEAMPLAILSTQSQMPEALFNYVLQSAVATNRLERVENGIRLKAYSAGLSKAQEESRKKILKMLSDNPRVAISRDDLLAIDSEAKKVFAFLKQQKQIVDIGGMIYSSDSFARLTDEILEFVKSKGKITVAEARDLTETSRKTILPILEELDRRQITKRDGDFRTLWQKSTP